MDRIKKILKDVFEWAAAIFFLLSGYLIYKYIKDRFFGTNTTKKDILNDIKENNKKASDLEKTSQNEMRKEKELQEKEAEIQEKMDKLKEEYRKKEEEFARKEQEIGGSNHHENIDYINKKYGG